MIGQLFNIFSVEMMKVRKAPVIWIVAAIFTIAPLMASFFTYILQDPQFAKNAGLLGDKAQIVGDATALSYVTIHAQMIAVGGIIVYGFVTSWIFGREYVDKTIIDLLVSPYSRSIIVTAKFLATFFTNIILTLYILVIGFVLGLLINVEGLSLSYFITKIPFLALITILTVIISTPIAFFATIGKGYLSPLGFVIIILIFSQIFAAIGFGQYFPWSIPALVSGIAGDIVQLNIQHILIIISTSVLGWFSTLLWWNFADYDS